MNESQLPARPMRSLPSIPGDFRHLETVVVVNFPIRAARSYLARQMGNPVSYRLVEAARGERVGHVRAAEVIPAEGGDPVTIVAVRALPDGTPAGPLVPDDLVERRAEIRTADGNPPRPLTPRDRVLLHVPVRSYLRFLPGVFQGGMSTPTRTSTASSDQVSLRRWGTSPDETVSHAPNREGTDAARQFLLLFQHLMTTVVDQVERLPALTNPLMADPRFLPWIASWVSFTLDESLPLHQQRDLVARAIRLYRTRGTQQGMEEMVRVLTAAPVKVMPREKPMPFVLGGSTLAGGQAVSDRYEKGEPPASFLYTEGRKATTFFALKLEQQDRFARRFSERAPAVLRRITQIVSAEKPAHVTFTLSFDEGGAG